MDQLKKAPYAFLGTGNLAVDKAKEILDRGKALSRTSRQDVVSAYEGLVKRGETVVRGVKRSRTTKRVVDGTQQATRQIKGAATSLRRAIGAEEASAPRQTRPARSTRKAG